jgi:hypothetical protein
MQSSSEIYRPGIKTVICQVYAPPFYSIPPIVAGVASRRLLATCQLIRLRSCNTAGKSKSMTRSLHLGILFVLGLIYNNIDI